MAGQDKELFLTRIKQLTRVEIKLKDVQGCLNEEGTGFISTVDGLLHFDRNYVWGMTIIRRSLENDIRIIEKRLRKKRLRR